MDFWDEDTIFRMSRGIGKPVSVDPRTLRHEYGYFAAALIDIDFSQPLGRILIDGEENKEIFVQDYEILNMPIFCDYCKSIGHKKSDCRTKKYDDLKDKVDEETDPEIKKSIEADMDDLKNFWQKERIPKHDGKKNMPEDPPLQPIIEKDQTNKPGDDPKTMKNLSILEIATGKHTIFPENSASNGEKSGEEGKRSETHNDGASMSMAHNDGASLSEARNDGASHSVQRNDGANDDGASHPEKHNDGAKPILRNDGEEIAENMRDNFRKEDDANLEMQEMKAYKNYEAMKEAARQREVDAEVATIQQ
ncbi:uncharacterized protein LOC113351487 [Papaver somniferum]|uniref:uncharacterized protein LOC113351487 n=1 Tax=Papaver somniferum TaxID=3469 RepID=UPI000E6FD1C2|nr:uncharacterized protein LOC113351487 [Papaver somniferum]